MTLADFIIPALFLALTFCLGTLAAIVLLRRDDPMPRLKSKRHHRCRDLERDGDGESPFVIVTPVDPDDPPDKAA